MDSRSANKKLNNGIIWQTFQVFSQRGVLFVIGVILARLLEPEDFGVYALISFFVVLSEVFTDGGMGVALVQQKSITDEDRSFVFSVNLSISIASYLILWFSAPWIAQYYSSPGMKLMIRVLSIKIIIESLRIVPFAELRRNLNFKRLSIGRVTGVIVGGIAGITLVFFNGGIWCLIIQQLVASSIISLLYFSFVPWKPQIRFSSPHVKQLLNFGIGILSLAVLNKLSRSIYTLIIGKRFTKEDLGFYNRALSLEEMTVQTGIMTLGDPSSTVMYRLQSDIGELRNFACHMLQLIGILLFPLLIGLACVSDQMVECVLGSKWLPSSPLLKILCANGCFYVLCYNMSSIFKALGRVKALVKIETFRQVLVILSAITILLFKGSIEMLLWSGVVTYLLTCLIMSYHTQKYIGYGLLLQIRALRKLISCSVIMGMAVLTMKYFINQWNCFVQLPLLILWGGLIYAGSLYFLKAPIFEECLIKVKERFLL